MFENIWLKPACNYCDSADADSAGKRNVNVIRRSGTFTSCTGFQNEHLQVLKTYPTIGVCNIQETSAVLCSFRINSDQMTNWTFRNAAHILSLSSSTLKTGRFCVYAEPLTCTRSRKSSRTGRAPITWQSHYLCIRAECDCKLGGSLAVITVTITANRTLSSLIQFTQKAVQNL